MAATAEQTIRRTAHEIFERVEDNGHEELRRSARALAFSGLAGGLTMGLTGLSVAAALATLPDSPDRAASSPTWSIPLDSSLSLSAAPSCLPKTRSIRLP